MSALAGSTPGLSGEGGVIAKIRGSNPLSEFINMAPCPSGLWKRPLKA